MNKKLLAIVLTCVIASVSIPTTSIFATSILEKAANREADPMAHLDPGVSMTRIPLVVTSDVWRNAAYIGSTLSYQAEGYVGVTDNSAPYFHYSRAEIWWNGSVAVAGSNTWGFGTVYATSPGIEKAGTAKIFYGW